MASNASLAAGATFAVEMGPELACSVWERREVLLRKKVKAPTGRGVEAMAAF